VVVLDHPDDIASAALFEPIAREHARLDILVNNAANAAGPVKPGGFWNNPWRWPT
jgi:NAD(P)-dependent dehydrogenase (short-subunit alcohol dehydrogenase family)